MAKKKKRKKFDKLMWANHYPLNPDWDYPELAIHKSEHDARQTCTPNGRTIRVRVREV